MLEYKPGCDIIYHPKCNRQVDVHFALLEVRSTLVGAGLLSPATILFNRPIRALLLQNGREPIYINNDDEYYKALKSRQEAYTHNNDTCKDSIFFSA